MGIVANRHSIDLRRTRVKVVKEMVADPVRRIARLSVDFYMPLQLSDDDKKRLENAGYCERPRQTNYEPNCYIAHALSEDKPEDVARCSAHCHANSHLLRALAYGVRDHRI